MNKKKKTLEEYMDEYESAAKDYEHGQSYNRSVQQDTRDLARLHRARKALQRHVQGELRRVRSLS